MNKLYFGDNLHVLRKYIRDETVDLIYLDPPFNSNAEYNLLFKAPSASGHRAQIQAFDDTWTWGEEAEQAFDDIIARGSACSALLQTFRSALGANDLTAYLVMMTVRLVELHRVLKATGSLYLHCDPSASHYLKCVLDAIFGQSAFRTEISWRRQSAHNDAKQGRRQYGNVRDVLLFYTKSSAWHWETQYTPYDEKYVKDFYKHREEGSDRLYRLSDLTGPGGAGNGNPYYEVLGVKRHWRFTKEKMSALIAEGRVVQTRPGAVPAQKRYLDEMPGVALQNDWTDIKAASGREAVGYPTQKPLALLERILSVSSRPGDVILDPFCGCGTAVSAAEKLGRAWIGIDVTHLAIHVIADRLGRDAPHAKFEILGQPTDLAGAEKLAELDKYQFQWWATWLCGGQPFGGERKGRDRGIDGTLEFVSRRGQHDWGIISVKGGKTVGPAMVRDLAGTVAREKASIGVFICLAEPSKEMEREAVLAGFVELGGTKYRKIQIRTIEQLLAGKAIDSPYLLTTAQEAPAAAKAPKKAKVRAIAPEELQKQRTLLLPIPGGRKDDRQKDFVFGESLLVTTPASPVTSRRRKA